MGSYARPRSLDEALRLRAAQPCVVLAGGTDFYPARVGRPIADDILDVSAVAGLRGINVDARGIRIGATTTWSDVLGASLPASFACLQEAAREVGGQQVQNAGTVAGNLCNASPAADGVPPLLALGAQVEIGGPHGVRVLPLQEFILGRRRTACGTDELVTAILLPARSPRATSRFLKLGSRRYLVISIAMVAACIDRDDAGAITHAAIAVGACSAVAQRLPAIETRLIGRQVTDAASVEIGAGDIAPLSPIDDIRASGEYRRDALVELIRRALASCAQGAA